MCGITGIIATTKAGKDYLCYSADAISKLNKRGPDASGVKDFENSSLAHSRLAIIDPTAVAAQPFVSNDSRYTLVYNGEIYNYKELKQTLSKSSVSFNTDSDTEVLLQWLIAKGKDGIQDLDGFFSFCFYDKQEDKYLLARDRFGIKPLVIYEDDNRFVFGSEMKAIFAFQPKKKIDTGSLKLYLKFNYLPQNFSMLEGVRKVAAGSYLIHDGCKIIEEDTYYSIDYKSGEYCDDSYETAQAKVRDLLRESVHNRMIADVPLGTFLSGGIDSSVITALASEATDNLNTFSVGFKDEPLFDETNYALLVAKKYKTNHTVFKLANNDLLEELYTFLDYTCEPFADSSALAVNALCKKTREKLTVALSGDGADELFSGYNKHMAEFLVREGGVKNNLVKAGGPLWSAMPKSRNSKLGNVARKLDKFAKGMKLSSEDRYWEWAGLQNDEGVEEMVLDQRFPLSMVRADLMRGISNSTDFNDFLHMDMQWVLPGDMLTKVDTYSMANSLEVRVPFLDHKLVDYVFSLPSEYKIQKGSKKRLLQDAFRSYLPVELYHRPKHGFEVPLLKWFRGELWSVINEKYLSKELVEDQKLFSYTEVSKLKLRLQSNDPGDSVANVWALVVFQHWWLKYIQ